MPTIAEHLGLNPNAANGLPTLHKLATLHTKYTQKEILHFYASNYTVSLQFGENSRMGLSQIFYRSTRLLENLDDGFYSLVLVHYFVMVNGFHYKDEITVDSLASFSEYVEKHHGGICYKKLDPDDRVIHVINSGTLSPYIFNVDSGSIELKKNTFRFLISHSISIPALMVYELDAGEIEAVSLEIIKNARFRSQCTEYIEEQGVINTTMFIISRLLGMDGRGRNIDHRKVSAMFCSEHDGCIYLPLSSFHRTGNLSKNEMYFLYLSNKTNFQEDLADIRKFFDSWSSSASPENAGDGGSTLSDENLVVGGRGVPDTCTSDTCLSLTPLSFKRPRIGCETEQSIYVQVLNMLFTKNVDFGFHRKAFALLLKLESEDYFTRVFCRYGREMVENNLKPDKNIRLYDSIEDNISYLKTRSIGNTCETACVDVWECSLESIDCGLFSSGAGPEPRRGSPGGPGNADEQLGCSGVDNLLASDGSAVSHKAVDAARRKSGMSSGTASQYPENLRWRIPILKFQDHPWMLPSQSVLLLENYLAYHSVDDVVDNFLFLSQANNSINDAFTRDYAKIRDKIKRGLVMCRLSIEIEKNMFTKQVVSTLLERTDLLFSLKNVILFEKVSQRHIARFLEGLSPAQETEVNAFVRSNVVSQGFITVYIAYITKRYEFSHLLDVLDFFIDSYQTPVIIKIQKYILSLIEDMFFTETYFDPISRLYKKMMSFDDKAAKILNESILSMILACGKVMDKEVFVGNVRG